MNIHHTNNINAANEVLVDQFLKKKIPFLAYIKS